MAFEDRGEDLQRLAQRELAERAADFYARFISGITALEEGASDMRTSPTFQKLFDLNSAFSDRLKDADNAVRHYSEARRKAIVAGEHLAAELYEHRLQELASEHARLADLWNSVLERASESNIFLPGGALLLAQKSKETIEESLPTIRETITQLTAERRTIKGILGSVSEEERRALEMNLHAVRIQCQEGQSLAKSAALHSPPHSAAQLEAERLIHEFEMLVDLLTEAYEDAERNDLLPR